MRWMSSGRLKSRLFARESVFRLTSFANDARLVRWLRSIDNLSSCFSVPRAETAAHNSARWRGGIATAALPSFLSCIFSAVRVSSALTTLEMSRMLIELES